jgi:hypothetical protein
LIISDILKDAGGDIRELDRLDPWPWATAAEYGRPSDVIDHMGRHLVTCASSAEAETLVAEHNARPGVIGSGSD